MPEATSSEVVFIGRAVKKNITPLDVICAIRIGIVNAEHRFTNGGCFQLYRVLKHLFPEAEAYYHNKHVYTKLGNMFYDINGEHEIIQDAVTLESEKMIYAKAHQWDWEEVACHVETEREAKVPQYKENG